MPVTVPPAMSDSMRLLIRTLNAMRAQSLIHPGSTAPEPSTDAYGAAEAVLVTPTEAVYRITITKLHGAPLPPARSPRPHKGGSS